VDELAHHRQAQLPALNAGITKMLMMNIATASASITIIG
jgi:hypothetical protein